MVAHIVLNDSALKRIILNDTYKVRESFNINISENNIVISLMHRRQCHNHNLALKTNVQTPIMTINSNNFYEVQDYPYVEVCI